MRKLLFCLMTLACLALAQDLVPVEVKGTGPDRTQAIEDAKRSAVEQALGAAVVGVTEMQDYMVIKDIVQSRASGYIANYEVIEETPLADRFEVQIRANVSKSPLAADAKSLQSGLGGFRIMVWYDFRSVTKSPGRSRTTTTPTTAPTSSCRATGFAMSSARSSTG